MLEVAFLFATFKEASNDTHIGDQKGGRQLRPEGNDARWHWQWHSDRQTTQREVLQAEMETTPKWRRRNANSGAKNDTSHWRRMEDTTDLQKNGITAVPKRHRRNTYNDIITATPWPAAGSQPPSRRRHSGNSVTAVTGSSAWNATPSKPLPIHCN